jgi:hypothetical protein
LKGCFGTSVCFNFKAVSTQVFFSGAIGQHTPNRIGNDIV